MKLLRIHLKEQRNKFSCETPSSKKYWSEQLSAYEEYGFNSPWVSYFAEVDNNLVGGAAIIGAPEKGKIEISFEVFSKYQNKGYETIICKKLVEKAFNAQTKLRIFSYTTSEENKDTQALKDCKFEFSDKFQAKEGETLFEWEYPNPSSYQKKLDSKREDKTGITEYEEHLLPNPDIGPYTLEDGYDNIFGYEFFSEIFLRESREAFMNDVLSEIPTKDYDLIEECLASYSNSSVKGSDGLFLLKKSILNTNPEILTELYKIQSHETNQSISKDYFESVHDILNSKVLPISSDSLLKYQDKAIRHTITGLSQFIKYLKEEYNLEYNWLEINKLSIFRGLGNRFYYKKNNFSDIISTYTKADGEIFFENKILSSYTISSNVAEKFMVAKDNTRRGIIRTTLETILGSKKLISSFLVSENFIERQFELLCVPHINPIYIFEDVNDRLAAEFYLNIENSKGDRLIRKPIEKK